MAERMNLHKWYSSSVAIPNYDSLAFPSFVATCIGLVRSIYKRNIGKQIQVSFQQHATGEADTKGMKIVINQQYLFGRVEGLARTLYSDEAITLILGIIVHEALHFAHSPKNLKPFAEYIKKRTKAHYDKRTAMLLGNLIEDVYIEAEGDRRLPSLTWMLEGMNDILFTEDRLGRDLDATREIISPPTSMQELVSIINLLILAKVLTTIDHESAYIRELFSLVRSATEPSKKEERYALALILYDELMNKMPESECEGSESFIEICEKGLRGATGSYEAGEISEDEVDVVLGSRGGLSKDDVDSVVRVNDVLDKLNKSDINVTSDDFNPNQNLFFVDTPLPLSMIPIDMDRRYFKLAELARQRASVNRPYGLDRVRGNNIRKLYRIGTDQKIFAESVSISNYKPMQVIILVDGSGSMMGGGADGSSRMKSAVEAALGAAYGLVDGRCDVAVYTHTADTGRALKDIVIFEAKSFGEPIDILGRRLQSACTNVSHSQNKDGYAIRHVGEKFTSHQRKRLLIVISDGEPAAPGYEGQEAIRHTEGEVKKLRKRGVSVLSISIDEGANAVNNYIYGHENNVYNEDPNVIEDIVRNLLL